MNIEQGIPSTLDRISQSRARKLPMAIKDGKPGGAVRDGKLIKLKVTPETRRKDIVVMEGM